MRAPSHAPIAHMLSGKAGWGEVKYYADVFEPPPEIIAGFMAHETEHALRRWNPFMWGIVKMRGLLVAGPVETMHARQQDKSPATWMRRLITFLRAAVFDYFGRLR